MLSKWNADVTFSGSKLF